MMSQQLPELDTVAQTNQGQARHQAAWHVWATQQVQQLVTTTTAHQESYHMPLHYPRDQVASAYFCFPPTLGATTLCHPREAFPTRYTRSSLNHQLLGHMMMFTGNSQHAHHLPECPAY